MIFKRILVCSLAGLLLPMLTSCFPNVGSSTSAPQRFEIVEATIEEIQHAYTAGTLTTVELVQAYLDRIAAYEDSGPTLNSIISLQPDALKHAAILDLERKQKGVRGPLHGIPVLLKDNIDTYDLPTTNGSAVLKGITPPDDATLTRELRAAGAIILGKASMGEFASGSYNSVSGQTVNPYNFKRDTGGSSSGSAAAIAANFAVLAVGTDTSTSVRGPSAFAGIVGMRPTTGLISRDGIAPKNLVFDTAGPMARTVTDVAHMLGVMGVEDPADPLSKSVWEELAKQYRIINGHINYSQFLDANALHGRRVGVIRDFFGGDPEIDTLAEAALGQIQALGATLVDIKLEPDFIARYLGDGASEIRRIADYRFRADWEIYLKTLPGAVKTLAEFIEIYEREVSQSSLPAEDRLIQRLKDSLTKSVEDPAYQQLIQQTLPQATADKMALFEKHKVDVLVFPYASSFAGVIRNPVYELEDPTYVDSDVPSPATIAGYNSTGFPGIAVPMGFGAQGLPIDLGFMGKPYSDGQLLGYAYAYEQASKQRKPSPLVPPL